jgi:secreted trypsin-like serine protease
MRRFQRREQTLWAEHSVSQPAGAYLALSSHPGLCLAGYGLLTHIMHRGALAYNDNSTPRELRKVQVPVVDRATCVERYATVGVQVFDHQICAAIDEGGKGVCFGDSGGPLIDEDTDVLIGIAVLTYKCGDFIPDRYTRVSTIVDWIKEQLA